MVELYFTDSMLLGAYHEIGEWWGPDPAQKKEVQLDIVALAAKEYNTQAGRQFIIGSCKYSII